MPLPGPRPRSSRVHLNYRTRAAERGRTPRVPSYFLKPPSSLGGDGDPVVRPRGTELLDFEGEIAVVIGTRARGVAPEDGLARDRLVRAGQRLRRLRLALGRPRLERARQGPGRLHADRPGRAPPPTVDPDALRPAHARQRRGRAGGHAPPNLIFALRRARRRPLALHDARARRRDPHRHARRTRGPSSPATSSRSSSRASGRVRSPIVEATASSRRSARMPRVIAARCARPRSAPTRRARSRSRPRRGDGAAPRSSTRDAHARSCAGAAIRNTFLGGLRPTRPDLRLLGYAHTLRYVAAARGRPRRGHGRAQRAEARRSRRSAPTRCS